MSTYKENKNRDDLTLKDFILQVGQYIRFLKSKGVYLIIFFMLGVGVSILYTFFKKPLYEAETTLVLDEDSKNTNGGLSLLGLNNKNSGLFDINDNIIWLYSSKRMIKKALFTSITSDHGKTLLINWYLKIHPGREKVLFFSDTSTDSTNFSIEQNALINSCILKMQNSLVIKQVKNAESIISISFKSDHELFTKVFMDALVSTVNEYYIMTKTKKINTQIEILEEKATNARKLLNLSIEKTAGYIDETPYSNPNLQSIKTPAQKKTIDIQVESALYEEIMKNLELKRLELSQARPIIQIIDYPELPLNIIKSSKIVLGLLGGIVFFGLGAIFFLAKYWIRNIMS